MNWTSNDDDLDTGVVGLISGGYNFGGPRVEVEGGYRYNGGQDGAFTKNRGFGQTYSLMVNGVYEFLQQESWHPFVGVGVGVASVHTKADVKEMIAGTGLYRSRTETLFAYQGMLGVAYELGSNITMRAQYRYFATADATKFRGRNGVKVDTPQNNHAILIGVGYEFY